MFLLRAGLPASRAMFRGFSTGAIKSSQRVNRGNFTARKASFLVGAGALVCGTQFSNVREVEDTSRLLSEKDLVINDNVLKIKTVNQAFKVSYFNGVFKNSNNQYVLDVVDSSNPDNKLLARLVYVEKGQHIYIKNIQNFTRLSQSGDMQTRYIKGLGSALLEEVKACKKPILLQVQTFGEGDLCKFYKKNGFKIINKLVEEGYILATWEPLQVTEKKL